MKCGVCGGIGWYADHDQSCMGWYEDGCDCNGVQIQCDTCQGTGLVENIGVTE